MFKKRVNLKLKLSKKSEKLSNILRNQKMLFFCVCLYKMVDNSSEKWKNAVVSVIKVHKNDNANKIRLLLFCISDMSKRWGVGRGGAIYDLIDKEIKGKFGA